ncbi:MAG: hypothetical protein FJZ04_00090 [Candidatus Moranbacteria bacterium]|nr:hypothetical protein [Candidatus Moranbacteria bacterium]
MDKLIEDIWKSVLSSLIVTTIILGGMRYFEREDWWKIDKKEDPDQSGPLVFYTVKGVNKDSDVSAQIFVKNIPQENALGRYGSFENIFPGQSVNIEIGVKGQTTRSPSFFVKNREIKNLSFLYENGKLEYQGESKRIRKYYPFRAVRINPKESNIPWAYAFAFDSSKLFYPPLETASAKER